jgi:hypothetical protein
MHEQNQLLFSQFENRVLICGGGGEGGVVENDSSTVQH